MASVSRQSEHECSFEFKVAFWLLAAFTVVAFVLWIVLPEDHRAIPILERTWPSLLTGFSGMVFWKLS